MFDRSVSEPIEGSQPSLSSVAMASGFGSSSSDITEFGSDSEDGIIARISWRRADSEDGDDDEEHATIAQFNSPMQPQYTNGQLDHLIDYAFRLGCPLWHNALTNGCYPRKRIHNFEKDRLRDGARIDVFRGEATDDYMNCIWAQWLENLPMYKARVMKSHNLSGTSVGSLGNALEVVAGLSFAARCNGYNLDKYDPFPSSWVQWPSADQSRLAWCRVWEAMKSRGLRGPVEQHDLKINAAEDCLWR